MVHRCGWSSPNIEYLPYGSCEFPFCIACLYISWGWLGSLASHTSSKQMSLIEARLHAAVMIASTYSHRSHWPKGSVVQEKSQFGKPTRGLRNRFTQRSKAFPQPQKLQIWSVQLREWLAWIRMKKQIQALQRKPFSCDMQSVAVYRKNLQALQRCYVQHGLRGRINKMKVHDS